MALTEDELNDIAWRLHQGWDDWYDRKRFRDLMAKRDAVGEASK